MKPNYRVTVTLNLDVTSYGEEEHIEKKIKKYFRSLWTPTNIEIHNFKVENYEMIEEDSN